jgi:Zn-dependent protease with chaperone function
VILALALLGYAVVTAAAAPALLTPLTRRGRSARAGLAAWVAAMTGALGAGLAALGLAIWVTVADWPQLTQTLCRSVAGEACTPAVYRSALYQAGVAALALVLTLAAVVAAWRCARRVQRSGAQTRTHARAALLVGRALDGADPRPAPRSRTVVLDDQRPAAYCVAGRPAAIVVTSGALAVLEPSQLNAVLAHERAHLACRHHALTTAVRGLAAAFPGVPLFTRAGPEVDRLSEMAADDSAARSAGRVTVASALLTLATGQPVAAPAVPVLAAAAYAVPARVGRLLAPSRPAANAFAAALLGALSALLAAGPALLVLLAR